MVSEGKRHYRGGSRDGSEKDQIAEGGNRGASRETSHGRFKHQRDSKQDGLMGFQELQMIVYGLFKHQCDLKHDGLISPQELQMAASGHLKHQRDVKYGGLMGFLVTSDESL